ncbi:MULTISPECIES: hypothetical protein [unclassified Psychrobacter]|uniref:hypothetical protein n=1 Tax=unclassified Psychrobacter TaxID=196806 RepID=UPI0018F47065|nr:MULTISPECIES: hypothetical protein [unclassified Psychrobacter]
MSLSPQPNAAPASINSNSLILSEVLTDTNIPWQIHNCKIQQHIVTREQPLPFLYHYDSLSDALKETLPLTPALLAKFDTPMLPAEAAALLGIDTALIVAPWHVKISGTLVVFSESLQLACRLNFSNTIKETQPIYTKDAEEAVVLAFKEWQFLGRVDVLYKKEAALISIDDSELAAPITIAPTTAYQQLPAAHAISLIAALEADKAQLPWFEAAILARIQ